jgi:uncharacterized repeat protein (TIGR01451 family)
MILFIPLNPHIHTYASSSNQPLSQEIIGKAPISFIPNLGQTDPSVLFQAQSPAGSLFFTSNQLVIVLPQARSSGVLPAGLAERVSNDLPEAGRSPGKIDHQTIVARINFEGANSRPEITGVDPQPGVVNFILGSDPSRWHTNLPTYAGIVYHGLYPGIDLLYNSIIGSGRHPAALKGTYTIYPGADPGLIHWRYEGAVVNVDRQGNLHIAYQAPPTDSTGGLSAPSTTGQIELIEQAPASWQHDGSKLVVVETRYRLLADGSVGFIFPKGYDRSQPLVLDPTLVYSSYLGDTDEDNGSGVAADSTGIYVSGLTFSTGFPTAGTPYQGDNAGGSDAYVTKFNSTGSDLIYSTYLGGAGSDYGLGFAVDTAGHAFVTGLTDSTDYPVSTGAYDSTCGQLITCTATVYDAFVTGLTTNGSGLLYSTYLGGDALDIGYSVVVGGSGDVYVAGRTESTNFPTAGTPYQDTNGGLADGFVAEIDPEEIGAASLIYSTYLGGTAADRINGIMVDSSGNAYVVGRTSSTDFPTAGTPFQNANAGNIDAIVAELDDDGSDLLYSTYLGGGGDDLGFTIAIDTSNRVYFTGQTNSTNFPTSTGAYDSTCGTDGACNGGFLDAFVAKFNTTAAGAASRVFSTYFGGSGDDSGQSIAVESTGNAYLTGYTDSTDMPVSNALQPVCGWGCSSGFIDAFVTRFNDTGSGLTFSTYLGGSSSDYAIAIFIDTSDTPFITGDVYSSDFPVANPYDGSQAGNYDAFITKIDNTPNTADLSVTINGPSKPVIKNIPLTYAATVSNAGNSPAAGLRLVDTLPAGVSLISATSSQGSCELVAVTALSCSLDNLDIGAPVTVTITVIPPFSGMIVNTASVMSNLSDPDADNNTATVTTTIGERGLYLPVIRK